METFISFLKYILQSNVINFILMLIILGWIVRKLSLGKSLDNSVSKVEESIKKSDNERIRADNVHQKAKALLKQLPQDIKALEDNADEKIEVFRNQIEENTQKSIFNLEKNIDRIIEIEEKKISNVLTDKTSFASVELAKQHLVELLEANPDLHNKFIIESLDELEKAKI